MLRHSALVLLVLLSACKSDKEDTAASGPRRLTILHTNDGHSHLDAQGPNAEYTPASTGDDGTIGGSARIATLVSQIRAESDHPVLLIDAGDFTEGTLFQLLTSTHASELQIMQAIGYDVLTLGNHEFEIGPNHLGGMIGTADANGVTLPIVATNLVPDPSNADDDVLEGLVASGRVASTLILTLDDGTTVGLFGGMGESAAQVAPAAAPVTFSPLADAATAAVADLRAQSVDIVVGITHAGVTDNPATSPDEVLAAAVSGMDVIIGGHSHTPINPPRTAGTAATPIVQAGCYGELLGQIDLVQNDDATWSVEASTLHAVDDSIAGDPEITAMVDGFKAALDQGPLASTGYTYDQPILRIPSDLPASQCVETGLGDLITDAFMVRMNLVGVDDPIDFAFESQGVIRDGLVAGDSGVQSFSDMFRALPLGFGTDDVPGYALVDFYITAAEALDTCEVSASISPSYGCNYFIELSGMRCNLDMSRSTFNRAQSIDRWTGAAWEPIDTASPELYHVAVDSYVASLMGILEDLTFGAIVITPKDAKGVPYASTDAMLFDADPSTGGVQEYKLWQALTEYALSFDDTDSDGIADLPASYTSAGGRITGW